jgi:hypothetical protein
MRYVLGAIAGSVGIVAAVSCGAIGGTSTGTGGGAGGTPTTSSSTGDTVASSSNGIFMDSGTDTGGGCSTLTTCLAQGADCGPISDGCGGILDCGTCAANKVCGAQMPNVCGGSICVPTTCAALAVECGPAGDGCGNQLDCGACTAPDTCGGGGTTSVCGHAMVCPPKTCGDLGITCGPAGDGCGHALDCGGCTLPDTCGGGGTSGACGHPVCVPKTCMSLGFDCGPAGDGCGGLLNCGPACAHPQVCGGLMSNVCGIPASCTNLCLQQIDCPSPATTSISGKVFAPNGTDPLFNALVYVPNAPVTPFAATVTCDTCGAQASGSPLVTAVTAVDGTFTLKNVPVGTNIPLVIQLGRWRRQLTVPMTTACVDTPVDQTATRMPRNKGEGDIPLMAFATGSLDALECVMRKVGIDDAEFTKPAGGGRMHIYTGSGSPGANAGPNTPNEGTLVGSASLLSKYDIVLFPCQGGEYPKSAAALQNLINYTSAGGRVFATHYSYVWFNQTPPFNGTAAWAPNGSVSQDPQIGFIDTTFPKGNVLAQWLQIVGASTQFGQIQLKNLRKDTNSVTPPSQLWIHLNDPSYGNVPMHFTFNTPVGAPAAQQCGRVVYDDYHVEEPFGSGAFPSECTPGVMTPQEKLLEFMLFDLASCVTPDIPSCMPKTCASFGYNCGPAGDGCGGLIDCGTCPSGLTCGGGGVSGVCGSPCTPATCISLNTHCGPAGDGCGGLLQCGNCPAGQTCGGGNMPGVCGNQTCTPKTCSQLNISCGPAGDGCGNLLQCGNCPAGQTCGGSGMPGVCGNPVCVPKTCTQLGFNCGPAGDGCGGLLQCGTCILPQTCGGDGTAGVCGGGGPPH